MRKIIETTSTLILWAIFIVGSTLAISDFLNAEVSKKVMLHLSFIAWSPVIAVSVFVAMMIAVRSAKTSVAKRIIATEHNIQWSPEEMTQAQTGKLVDLHFSGTGIECNVIAREEVAPVLHSENQTLHVTVAAPTASEQVRALLPQAL